MTGLLEISSTGYAYICIGGFIALFSTVSLFARERAYVNEVVIATAFGILMGPLCADIFDPRSWGNGDSRITLEILRVVLATGLFAIGADLPRGYLWKHAKGLLIMVVPTMTVGWFIVAGLLKAIFPRFSYVTCLAIAACLTPTDPIISASVVGGGYAKKNVPAEIRHILLAESAANDGLAYPFLSITVFILLDSTLGDAIKDWVLVGWLFQVILGSIVGAVIGYIFAYVMKFSHKRSFSNHESYMAQCLALAILTMGIVKTIGSDDLLGAFAAGYTFTAWDDDSDDYSDDGTPDPTSSFGFTSSFVSVLDYLLNCGCFIYIGAWFKWEEFTLTELGIQPWKLVVLSIGILALRRLPALILLYKWVPEIKDLKEALFCGHFGPMGVGALFIASLAKHRLPEPRNPPETQEDYLAMALYPVVSFVVLISIIVHGLSIAFVSLGKKVHRRTYSPKPDIALKSRTVTTDTQATLYPQIEIDVNRKPPHNSSKNEKFSNEASAYNTKTPSPEFTSSPKFTPSPEHTPDPEVRFSCDITASKEKEHQSDGIVNDVLPDDIIEEIVPETRSTQNDSKVRVAPVE
ncbi:hypothetical protein AGABI1DRAFT_112841 [Agaricus bisporus var. burnettii JB137-S8]|uniref:Cation/H+ exchanger transmembrane domain-containing protein n=1 Tax=Agaricus bisporus var. burnettii (strain JB137-S8 / ATCC MYA-4627 / FGSC 10392) TaxID=597362 RepID=K5XCW0_AGABU|nr:uncharacterized protein AGABI1DRAFT_112841 [Agaricus bisporus var. burnettii JB137-S8]EKM81148.1 hypothetical protein AGABI1DRAFT_112841 [Agaricus bisporus var. burnettii JB137-S8]